MIFGKGVDGIIAKYAGFLDVDDISVNFDGYLNLRKEVQTDYGAWLVHGWCMVGYGKRYVGVYIRGVFDDDVLPECIYLNQVSII